MKTNYPTKKLGEVCSVVGGGTPSTVVAKYWGEQYAWVTPKDLGQLRSIEIHNSTKKITEAGLDNSSATLLPIGSVILSSRAPIGYVAINTVPMATNQGCRSFVCGDEIYNRYLYYFLLASRNELQAGGSGSTFAEISGSRLKQIQISLPPVAEQKRIVTKIEKQFAKIDEATRLRIESQALVDKLIPAALQEVFSSAESKMWKEEKLGEVSEIVTGKTPPTTERIYYGEDILWAGPSDLDSGKFILQTRKQIAKKAIEDGAARTVPAGSVLVSCIGIIGKVGIAAQKMATNQQINVFIPDEKKISSDFLYYTIKAHQSEFEKRASRTTLPIINKSRCAEIKIFLPPLVEQKRIVKKLDALSDKVRTLRDLQAQQAADLKTLKQAILYEAFNHRG